MKKQLCLFVAIIVSLSAQGQCFYRMVQGKVVAKNALDWTVISDKIEVKGFMGGALLCSTFTETQLNTTTTIASAHKTHIVPTTTSKKVYKDSFILTNYPAAGRFHIGDLVPGPISVMRVAGMGTTALYDYGIDYYPPQRALTPEEAAAAKAQAAKRNAGADAAILKLEIEQADNGLAPYQYRLGMRYLNGNGVEKDQAKALEYLGKAAAQGNQDAAKALAKISAPKN